MSLTDIIRSALLNVYSHKMRSILTMLGIIIGIGSVITITSLGSGVKNSVYKEINGFNKATIMVYVIKAEGYNDMLLDEDVENLLNMKDIKTISVSKSLWGSKTPLKQPDTFKDGPLVGADGNYRMFEDVKMIRGRFITKTDVDYRSNVAVISNNNALEIFGRLDILGEVLAIENWAGVEEYTIVGVFETPDSKFVSSDTRRALAIVPVSSLNELTGADYYDSMMVEISDLSRVGEISRRITNYLETTHSNKDGYYVDSLSSQTKTVDTVMSAITGFISFVAAISLFVGGVGVMNIMLVTVTERTREIGIRKSLGATDNNIKFQFLLEAVILTGIGGIVGIIFGMLGAVTIGIFIKSAVNMDIIPSMSLASVLTAFGFSALVGLIFGVYPAGKAAKLDPIEALRYE